MEECKLTKMEIKIFYFCKLSPKIEDPEQEIVKEKRRNTYKVVVEIRRSVSGWNEEKREWEEEDDGDCNSWGQCFEGASTKSSSTP